MTKWQNISTAPKDGTQILIWNGQDTVVAWWDDVYIWVSPGAWISYLNRSDTDEYEPTHWMPLPAPPKDAGA